MGVGVAQAVRVYVDTNLNERRPVKVARSNYRTIVS